MTINDIDLMKVLKKLEEIAWYGGSNNKLLIIRKNDVIELKGYIYEPSYESFSATHSISLNGEVLFGRDSRNIGPYNNETYIFGKMKTESEAIQYLKEYLKNDEITIQNSKPNEEYQEINDESEVDEEEI